MPKYVLHYFKIEARGELPRLLFEIADVEYEYKTLAFDDTVWEQHKDDYEFNVLPVLEVDGVQLNQSYAIALYLAKEFGLAGANNFEEAQIVALNNQTADAMEGLDRILHEAKDLTAEALQAKFTEYKDVTLKKFVGHLENYLKKHGSTEGFFVGNKLSLADLNMVISWHLLKKFAKADTEEYLASYPGLYAHWKRVHEIPKVKHFFEVTMGAPYQ